VRVRVHVAGCHALHAETPRERSQGAVACAIAPQVGALQLDVQIVGAERVEQSSCRRLVGEAARRERRADQRTLGAAGQADEPLRMVDHRLQIYDGLASLASRRPLAGVGVSERDDPAEVAPAALVAHEQREVTRGSGVIRAHVGAIVRAHVGIAGRPKPGGGSSRRWSGHVNLRAVDRLHRPVLRRLGQLHRA
jgi:hypothetical protein